MAKVIRAFRERRHDMKRYDIGDDYPETDKKRVEYLVQQGFLEKPKRAKKGADADGDSNG